MDRFKYWYAHLMPDQDMRFAVFRLEKGERLKCNECNEFVKGEKGMRAWVYFQEATRSDPPSIGKVLCPKCMQIQKDRAEGTDVKIIIVGEE
jgi:hypothetical protein